MEAWIDLTDKLMNDEILQLELLCRELIESLPAVVAFGVPILFGLAWLLAALDGMFADDRDLQPSDKGSRAEEHNPRSPGDRLSKPATRLVQSEVNAAA